MEEAERSLPCRACTCYVSSTVIMLATLSTTYGIRLTQEQWGGVYLSLYSLQYIKNIKDSIKMLRLSKIFPSGKLAYVEYIGPHHSYDASWKKREVSVRGGEREDELSRCMVDCDSVGLIYMVNGEVLCCVWVHTYTALRSPAW